MPGGSAEPDDRDAEGQCQHCGRWYKQRGVRNHEDNCPFADADHRIHDLDDPHARMRAGMDPHPADESEPETPETDVVEGRPTDAPDTNEPVPEANTTATDGGPSKVPDFGGDDDPDDVEEDETAVGCPTCGSPEYVAVDDLPDDVLDGLADAAPELVQKDRLCWACSFDDDGQPATETVDGERVLALEAYDVEEGQEVSVA